MESEYDRKLEEMKSYIPFLERMIRRLETTSTSPTNPRQAQLDKIRSLRDLLLDKKKRMKMENLLKCEQVLVNLYAKVEAETLPGIKKASEPLFPSNASTSTETVDLNSARNKLQTVSTQNQRPKIEPDTLPEIAPASEIEEVCTPGSKEPALFQRRPNKNSLSPGRESSSKEGIQKKSPQKTVPKRNYTRVLVSPEPSSGRWTPSDKTSPEKPLYSRRSPHTSPKRHSMSERKEKKKSSKPGKPKTKDLSITLNVPEESLDSLNTDDILSRIIKCPDSDVDIDTLRDLRKQILGKLKQTGASEDISDLILRSYKSKKKNLKKHKEVEVEEGELSDSESEVIESVYGSLVVVDKGKTKSGQTRVSSTEKEIQAGNIKIRLVINSDKEEIANQNEDKLKIPDATDFEVFDIEENIETKNTASIPNNRGNHVKTGSLVAKPLPKQKNVSASIKKSEELITINVEDDDEIKKDNKATNHSKDSESSCIDISSSDNDCNSPKINDNIQKSDAGFKANFYKEHEENIKKDAAVTDFSKQLSPKKLTNTEIIELDTPKAIEKPSQENIQAPKVTDGPSKENIHTPKLIKQNLQENKSCDETNNPKNIKLAPEITTSAKDSPIERSAIISQAQQSDTNDDVQIPLLNTKPVVSAAPQKDIVSEIDILQALKNEILGESLAIPGADTTTPALHQPKLTKVASAQEILSKKRISIEKYKEKSVAPLKDPLFVQNPKSSKSKDHSKKTLKLTEQEQQRFNFLPLPLDDSSEEEKETDKYSVDDIYKDLAPKSPENIDINVTDSSTPVIIPVDPVKCTIASSKADIDMRTMMPLLSPNTPSPVQPSTPQLLLHSSGEKCNEKQPESRRPLLDPRMRRDLNKPISRDSPNPYGSNPERTPKSSGNYPSMTSTMSTYSRSFEMTPSRQSFEFDEGSSRKHVYAPFPTIEPRENKEQSVNRDTQGPRWEPNAEPVSEERNRWDLWKDSDLHREPSSRSSRDSADYYKHRHDSEAYQKSSRNDSYSYEMRDDYSYSRMDCPRTPIHSFGRSDCPTTPTPSFGRVDPPIVPFGRSECPMTPNHPFGRSEMPMTPNHPIGRGDMTPSHPFGRSEAPLTPSHSFGRSETPMTPSHPFGRSEAPMTPSHSFGRSEAPMTPSHPFGRSEAPMTPSHPFGRSEAPMTPSHPFGRSEMPRTPNHPFGRGDMTPNHSFGRPDVGGMSMTPTHSFGRSDYQQSSVPKVIKDPRLNRSNEYESNRKFDETRDRGYYKDRRKSDLPNRSYNSSDSYRNYKDQSTGRNETSKNELIIDRHNRERTPGRDTSAGLSVSRKYDNDRLTKGRGESRSSENRRENNKSHSQRDFQRSQSIGRSGPTDDKLQRSSWGGDNTNCQKPSKDNTLSVKPQSGRSFTIDTSVNSTFQEFLNGKGLPVIDYSFDSRRRRAASVGRTFIRETSMGRNIHENSVGRTFPKSFREGSVGRNLPKTSIPTVPDTSGYKKMVNFVRARSMGREFIDKTERSFKEIKADLQSYKISYKYKETPKSTPPIKKTNNVDPRSKKEQYDYQEKKSSTKSNKKTAYSPRKNNRDPRMYSDNRSNRYADRNKVYGIVYSSDNIAKGAILGSGYGVKNYKIPKIKKPLQEEPKVDNTDSNKVDKKVEKISSDKKKTIETKEIDKKSNKKENLKKNSCDIRQETSTKLPRAEKNTRPIESDTKQKHQENVIKKPTRRSKTLESAESQDLGEKTVIKSRKAKKPIIESDSEPETVPEINTTEVPRSTITDDKDEAKHKEKDEKVVDKGEEKQKDEDNIFDNSCGIDDLGIFTENFSIDPSLENINALIANLDNDIDTTKSEDFSKDISLDNMFESINSPECDFEKSLSETIKNFEQNQVLDKLSTNMTDSYGTLGQTCGNFEEPSSKEEIKIIKDLKETTPLLEIPFGNKNEDQSEEKSLQDNTIQNSSQSLVNLHHNEVANTEAIVSTTEINKDISQQNAEKNEDRPSTPDSTLNCSPVPVITSNDAESLPDSTNDKCEMNLDVTSSHDQVHHSAKETKENPVNAIGNLLSILQDKSKIKELLSLIGDDQLGENEKLKKKLEKLSEIVSDDDDSNERINDSADEKEEIEVNKDIQDQKVVNTNVEQVSNDKQSLIEGKKEDSVGSKTDDSIRQNQELPADADSLKKIARDSLNAESELLVKEKTIDQIPISDANLNSSSEDVTNVEESNQKSIKTVKKVTKKGKGKKINLKRNKRRKCKKELSPAKRATRFGAITQIVQKPKKPSRELRLLQESIKEMFIKDDVLKVTGIRMCRLAKLVDDKNTTLEDECNMQSAEVKPVVVLEKITEKVNTDEKETELPKLRKKPGPKPKTKLTPDNIVTKPKDIKVVSPPKYKPGPKSKKKSVPEDSDPYSFDDSVSEATTAQTSELENDSPSEDDSMASSKSCCSSEVLADLKKKTKRRKPAWQSGIINKKKRKKFESKQTISSPDEHLLDVPNKEKTLPDMNCFTDKTYCFVKNVTEYPCRLCNYHGPEIVKHYKTDHPHTEIPLSRMNAVVAREAVEQCEDVNFQAISKIPSDKYVCRFCFEEFSNKKNVLEEFFWHVVSMHTGEYKRICSECVNVTRCPFNLDIPPPPKDLKGQLIGYICGKCNFAQISLENLKLHVIVRHNDEQTAVYTINLAVMSKKTIQTMMRRYNSANDQVRERVLRSSRSNPSIHELSDPSDRSDLTDALSDMDSLKTEQPKIAVQSKLTFESDDNTLDTASTKVKEEKEDNENENQTEELETDLAGTHSDTEQHPSSDILDCPHFKICHTKAGTKEYVCCINGKDRHYKTTLLISIKKHVQLTHQEIWDGYCSVCKVIIMPQGEHRFKDCLQHMLDKHMDNFPLIEELEDGTDDNISSIRNDKRSDGTAKSAKEAASPKTLINIVPLSTLLAKEGAVTSTESEETLPKIQSVVSLGTESEPPRPDPSYPPQIAADTAPGAATLGFKCAISLEKPVPKPEAPYKYEEMQAEIMSKKHLVILQSMLAPDKLVHIYKCAGRYCSFTSDSADAALLHASTHQRIGGENALLCSYCDYNCNGNAIDLVMHVFKMHGHCSYVCGQCFYRAVASQQVLAHVQRIHGGLGAKILQTETVTPVAEDTADVLPREVAVQHYVCVDAATSCKFKTYIPGKFIEHLGTKHTPPYLCHVCSIETQNATELLHHLTSHGLKLYQCTWCMEGADNEGDFLAHSSARHATRQPQAYLRIITTTNKDGASKSMVLPLVKLYKSSIPTCLVAPQNNIDDPAKAAEKALDMEKLIISMPFLNDNATKITPPAKLTKSIPSPQIPIDDSISAEELILSQEPRLVTPPPSTTFQTENDSVTITPILKTEPVDATPEKGSSSAVICLDSDEEDPRESPPKERQSVIDLSDDDQSSVSTTDQSKKYTIEELYKCANCNVTFKSLTGFKRHLSSCLHGQEVLPCAHCSIKISEVDELLNHYNFCHSYSSSDMQKPTYSCGVCNRKEKTLWAVKNHAKKQHGLVNFTVSTKEQNNYVVKGTIRSKPGPKRKISSGTVPDSAPKRMRFGAQDLHMIPQKPILDEFAYCSECEFYTKVRLNLVRHIQQHAENIAVPSVAPVNPVPHLESNEKHFDKMINLASSSLEIARIEKPTPSVTLHIPPEAASRYPKYVPDKQRHTCGAKGCSYISLDEAMLKCHWETLHAGSNDFHCVHCPPYQHLDTSKPLTASRIIAHLKMHDIRLYACSLCVYYHYRKQVLEKHLADVHKGTGQIMIVREEATNPPPAKPQTSNAAPTMDLKPWKCGLCIFKSMLRPEVIEHCSKNHNTKMQFKCPVCPFRTSTLENVTKHKSNSHPGNDEDVFYYYYREGSIPDEPDGTPRWMKQRQKMGNPEPEVKSESISEASQQNEPPPQPILPSTPTVDLNKVKEEVIDPDAEDSIEELCRKFGDICDPNGLKYRCPLCKLVTEENKDVMQSHLYEELQYRKWACGICCYKAFHETGLNEHMITEHRQHRTIEPIELPANVQVERWVNHVLEYQAGIIETNKTNLTKQKIQVERQPLSSTSKLVEIPQQMSSEISSEEFQKEQDNLIQAFGEFGSPDKANFRCPKCQYLTPDEGAMKDHLEIELNKIRWRCSICWENSQNYHEAQLHSKTCKKSYPGQMSRPVEAVRDPSIRAAWLAAVINSQKQGIKLYPAPEFELVSNDTIMGPSEDSLLVVRYEEDVPTPEEEMINRRKRPAPTPSAAPSPDSDDERLVIDEPSTDESETPKKKPGGDYNCPYCPWSSKYRQPLEFHILRHYNLKPLTCAYCNETFHNAAIENHTLKEHPDLPKRYSKTKPPPGPPLVLDLCSKSTVKNKPKRQRSLSTEDLFVPRTKERKPSYAKEEVKKDDGPKFVCLVCEKGVPESDKESHVHDKPTYFAKKGEVVVKCCVCLLLFPNIEVMQEHNRQKHPGTSINYAYFKLNHDTREILQCGHCNKGFKFFRDLKSHHNVVHSALQLKYENRSYHSRTHNLEFITENKGESSTTDISAIPGAEANKAAKRVAKKSTTKLPMQAVARKSTTKLPYRDDEDEYSHYGKKPTPLDHYDKVTTLMQFCNTMMPFTLQKLSEIIKINPVVLVKDCKK